MKTYIDEKTGVEYYTALFEFDRLPGVGFVTVGAEHGHPVREYRLEDYETEKLGKVSQLNECYDLSSANKVLGVDFERLFKDAMKGDGWDFGKCEDPDVYKVVKREKCPFCKKVECVGE